MAMAKFWVAEMLYFTEWVRLPGLYLDRRDAEWNVGLWKQQTRMTGDPFRYIEIETEVGLEVEDPTEVQCLPSAVVAKA